jgi:hypothetical protein
MSNCHTATFSAGLLRRASLIALTALSAALGSMPVSAQNTVPPPFPDPSKCPIPNGIKSFVVEQILGPNAFQSAFTPNPA